MPPGSTVAVRSQIPIKPKGPNGSPPLLRIDQYSSTNNISALMLRTPSHMMTSSNTVMPRYTYRRLFTNVLDFYILIKSRQIVWEIATDSKCEPRIIGGIGADFRA